MQRIGGNNDKTTIIDIVKIGFLEILAMVNIQIMRVSTAECERYFFYLNQILVDEGDQKSVHSVATNLGRKFVVKPR
jgi:hypothetical protein